jgi:hypothetical protein
VLRFIVPPAAGIFPDHLRPNRISIPLRELGIR